jgi:uncharacterized pyridoxamine 5'-phosphate oxidase family protein
VERELDFESKKQEIVEFLANKHAIVLATSLDDRVTARTVSLASDGLEICFMSWDHHTKCVQMRGNPRVAMCRDNVQIEGVAEILGSPLEERNRKYAGILKEKYPREYRAFAHELGMVIVKVVPTLIATWSRADGQPCLEYLDLENQTAYRKGVRK